MEHDLFFDNFYPYNVLLAIATNIPNATYDWFCGPGSNLEKYQGDI